MTKNPIYFQSPQNFQKITYCGQCGQDTDSPCFSLTWPHPTRTAPQSSCLPHGTRGICSGHATHRKLERELERRKLVSILALCDKKHKPIGPATSSLRLPTKPRRGGARPRQIHTLLPGGKRGDQLASMFLPIPSVQADQGHFLKAACLEQGTACLLSFRLRFSL